MKNILSKTTNICLSLVLACSLMPCVPAYAAAATQSTETSAVQDTTTTETTNEAKDAAANTTDALTATSSDAANALTSENTARTTTDDSLQSANLSSEAALQDESLAEGKMGIWLNGYDSVTQGYQDLFASSYEATTEDADDTSSTLASSVSLTPMIFSDEMLYFCKYESSCNYDQGLSSGDDYHAMGFFQFDNRYGLGSFLEDVYNYDPVTFSCLATIGNKYDWDTNRDTRADGAFTEFGNDLNAAWHAAYAANPSLFSQLQNGWAYENYFNSSDGVRNALAAMGINIDKYQDCVRGLVWGMTNLFGKGGGASYINQGLYYGANWFYHNSGINGNMTDEEFVSTLCNYVVDHVAERYPSQPQYHEGWENRYRNELKDCLAYIDAGSADHDPETIQNSQIAYRSHVQNIGWQAYKKDGAISGTVSRSYRVEAFEIQVGGELASVDGSVEYCAHVSNVGWQDYVSDGAVAGTTGEEKQVEALRIRLTGELSESYDIYYRAHIANVGWMGWAKNGGNAGTIGYAYQLEALQIVVLPKGSSLEGVTEDATTTSYQGAISVTTSPFLNDDTYITYTTHVQNYGWQDNTCDGQVSGTLGQSLRLEAIRINKSSGLSEVSGSVEYRTHVQDYGWQGWVSNGGTAGTSGESKRLEAIRIRLTGDLEEIYDIYYRVHSQNIGWMGWTKNGEIAGTEGLAYRLEAIQIVILPKGSELPGVTSAATTISYEGVTSDTFASCAPLVSYDTHVQNVGWQDYVTDGSMSGTSGMSYRLEAIRIELGSVLSTALDGSITYKSHVENDGWQDWVQDGALSGTSGESKRLEAIQIKLTGDIAEYYDVYYRVHTQNIGWMNWAKNGEEAGTAGMAYRLEAIQIVVLPKDVYLEGVTSAATTAAYKGITSDVDVAFDEK